MSKTKIEWADMTINPVIGCSPISDGCKHCYASKMFPRLKGMGTRIYEDMEDFSDISWSTRILLDELQKLKKPKRIFICSMSDLFHDKVPDDVISNVLTMCGLFPQHTFMILTKRYKRMADYRATNVITKNILFGISICNSVDLDFADMIFEKYNLYNIFISFEPLLNYISSGDIDDFIKDHGVNWIIVGAETGPGHRNFEESWALDILNIARKNEIPFFFKQRYLSNGSKTDILGGCNFHEIPVLKEQ